MTEPTDLGPGELYPFCPWEPLPGGRRRRGRPPIYYARNGDPDRIVTKVERSAREGRAVRAQTVDTLEWYHHRKPDLIPQPMYSAGRRLRDTYETCLIKAGISAFDFSRERVSGGARRDLGVSALDSVEELTFALDYVGGPELDSLLLSVVCQNQKMEEFERRHAWRTGGGQIALRIALYRLALHYGYIQEPRRRRIAP